MSKELPKDKEPLPPLSDRDRDHFLEALERPACPLPESISKAKANYTKLVVSDTDEE